MSSPSLQQQASASPARAEPARWSAQQWRSAPRSSGAAGADEAAGWGYDWSPDNTTQDDNWNTRDRNRAGGDSWNTRGRDDGDSWWQRGNHSAGSDSKQQRSGWESWCWNGSDDITVGGNNAEAWNVSRGAMAKSTPRSMPRSTPADSWHTWTDFNNDKGDQQWQRDGNSWRTEAPHASWNGHLDSHCAQAKSSSSLESNKTWSWQTTPGWETRRDQDQSSDDDEDIELRHPWNRYWEAHCEVLWAIRGRPCPLLAKHPDDDLGELGEELTAEEVRANAETMDHAQKRKLWLRPRGFHSMLEGGLNPYQIWKKSPGPVDSAPSTKLLTLPPCTPKYSYQPLPHPWTAHYDENFHRMYFHNNDTKVSQWEPPPFELPPPPPPPPPLSDEEGETHVADAQTKGPFGGDAEAPCEEDADTAAGTGRVDLSSDADSLNCSTLAGVPLETAGSASRDSYAQGSSPADDSAAVGALAEVQFGANANTEATLVDRSCRVERSKNLASHARETDTSCLDSTDALAGKGECTASVQAPLRATELFAAPCDETLDSSQAPNSATDCDPSPTQIVTSAGEPLRANRVGKVGCLGSVADTAVESDLSLATNLGPAREPPEAAQDNSVEDPIDRSMNVSAKHDSTPPKERCVTPCGDDVHVPVTAAGSNALSSDAFPEHGSAPAVNPNLVSWDEGGRIAAVTADSKLSMDASDSYDPAFTIEPGDAGEKMYPTHSELLGDYSSVKGSALSDAPLQELSGARAEVDTSLVHVSKTETSPTESSVDANVTIHSEILVDTSSVYDLTPSKEAPGAPCGENTEDSSSILLDSSVVHGTAHAQLAPEPHESPFDERVKTNTDVPADIPRAHSSKLAATAMPDALRGEHAQSSSENHAVKSSVSNSISASEPLKASCSEHIDVNIDESSQSPMNTFSVHDTSVAAEHPEAFNSEHVDPELAADSLPIHISALVPKATCDENTMTGIEPPVDVSAVHDSSCCASTLATEPPDAFCDKNCEIAVIARDTNFAADGRATQGSILTTELAEASSCDAVRASTATSLDDATVPDSAPTRGSPNASAEGGR